MPAGARDVKCVEDGSMASPSPATMSFESRDIFDQPDDGKALYELET